MVKSVKVYSSPTCPYCDMAKDFLKKNNIDFEDIDVREDAQAAQEAAEKSGQRGVPVIDIDGEIIVGFNQEAIAQALKEDSNEHNKAA